MWSDATYTSHKTLQERILYSISPAGLVDVSFRWIPARIPKATSAISLLLKSAYRITVRAESMPRRLPREKACLWLVFRIERRCKDLTPVRMVSQDIEIGKAVRPQLAARVNTVEQAMKKVSRRPVRSLCLLRGHSLSRSMSTQGFLQQTCPLETK